MFKFLKNLFSPVQVPPQKPESHPLDGATRAAHEKNPLIVGYGEVVLQPVTNLEAEAVITAAQPADPAPAPEKKPRKPRAKKEQPAVAPEAEWPFGTPVAAMTPAKKPRKPRAKKAE